MLEIIKNNKKLLLVLGGIILTILTILLMLIGQGAQERTPPKETPAPKTGKAKTLPLIQGTELPKLTIHTASGADSNSTGLISFTLTEPVIPETLPIYSSTSIGLSDSFMNILAQALIPDGARTSGTNIWSSDKKRLSIHAEGGFVEYTSEHTSTGETLSQQELVEIAERFLIDLNLISSDQLNETPKITYFISRTSDLVETNDIDMANVFDISYSEWVEGKKIYRQYGSSAQTHVWITEDGEIIRLSYRHPLSIRPINTVRLLTTNEIRASASSLGTITRIGSIYQEELFSEPLSTEITALDVGYFEDKTNDTLLPIVVLGGVSFVDYKSEPVTIYMPAYK